MIPAGEVLDLACGSGRHSRMLVELGHDVLALDRDADLLARVADDRITAFQFDLENGSGNSGAWPFEIDRFVGIVVTNYLHRPLFPHIVKSLAANGVLIYETFAQGNELFGKPSNPAFLLQHGELLTVAASHSLRVIAFEEGYVESPKAAVVQRICAAKADFSLSMKNPYLI